MKFYATIENLIPGQNNCRLQEFLSILPKMSQLIVQISILVLNNLTLSSQMTTVGKSLKSRKGFESFHFRENKMFKMQVA